MTDLPHLAATDPTDETAACAVFREAVFGVEIRKHSIAAVALASKTFAGLDWRHAIRGIGPGAARRPPCPVQRCRGTVLGRLKSLWRNR